MTRENAIIAALLACRHAFAGDRADALAAALAAADPAAVRAYARRHRVSGLIWQAVAALGAERASPFAALAQDAAATRTAALRQIDAIGAIEDRFARERIDRVHLKGMALAARCWPDPLAKESWDIDLMIAPATLDRAAAALHDLGYRCVIPGAPLGQWHRRRKESVWRRDADGTSLELHTRALPWPGIGPTLATPRQSVTLPGGMTVETFADAPLAAYLALHGASSLWFRLKWLADYAALVHRRAPPRAAGRASRLADRLAAELFDVGAGPRMDILDRTLLRLARRELVGGAAWREPTATPLGTLPIHVAQAVIGGPADVLRQGREAFR